MMQNFGKYSVSTSDLETPIMTGTANVLRVALHVIGNRWIAVMGSGDNIKLLSSTSVIIMPSASDATASRAVNVRYTNNRSI